MAKDDALVKKMIEAHNEEKNLWGVIKHGHVYEVVRRDPDREEYYFSEQNCSDYAEASSVYRKLASKAAMFAALRIARGG